MNQRLRELMVEAGYAAPEIAGRANKLAELIVRECQFAIVSRSDLPLHERKLYNNVLKQHFGVEE